MAKQIHRHPSESPNAAPGVLERSVSPVVAVLVIVIMLLVLAGFTWVVLQSKKSSGPGKMVAGSDGTLYMEFGNSILKVTEQGYLLEEIDLREDLGVEGELVDFSVEPNGGFILGLSDPDKIVKVSSSGEVLDSYPFYSTGTPLGMTPFFRFSVDRESGRFFLADSDADSLVIFDSAGNEIRRVTEAPLYANGKLMPQEIAFDWTNGVEFANGKLYLSDANNQRVVELDTDGQVLRTFDLKGKGRLSDYNPFDLYVRDRMLAVAHGNPKPYSKVGGVVFFDLADGALYPVSKETYRESFPDFLPDEIYVGQREVLVADPADKHVLRFGFDGSFLGLFGDDAFQEKLKTGQKKRSIFLSLQMMIFQGLIFVLVVVVVIYIVISRRNVPSGTGRRAPSSHTLRR